MPPENNELARIVLIFFWEKPRFRDLP